ncbi:hypothetical protein ElyMa_003560100 [Elysia marginata]|uniref:Uncharacterized protein n=1 Tax=Elysia marginata TaxID=1093978 RepID=A0AAV4ELI3_9GAST|nr:hypothetical protein ElyMa_003560100 [Elysia marginata]
MFIASCASPNHRIEALISPVSWQKPTRRFSQQYNQATENVKACSYRREAGGASPLFITLVTCDLRKIRIKKNPSSESRVIYTVGMLREGRVWVGSRRRSSVLTPDINNQTHKQELFIERKM